MIGVQIVDVRVINKKKMKVGILTVTGDNNYGNKLQNYALQKIVYSIGCEVETIRVEKNNYKKILLLTIIQYIFSHFLTAKKRKVIRRRMLFLRFNRNICQGKTTISDDDSENVIERKLSKFDYLLYGSDQIWNPDFPQFSVTFLGKYAPKEKNISISASIGRSTIPDDYLEMFKDGIHRFKAISVREEEAQNFLRKLDDSIETVVLVDPTLVLTKEQWTSIEREIPTPEHYCVIYFLGSEDTEFIKTILDERKCKCINIGSNNTYGPGEFIYLIRNADIVITDSFHASLFSLVFGIELYVRKRCDKYTSMNSRIVTLLSKIGVPYVIENDGYSIKKDVIKDESVQRNVAIERQRFIQFICTNMNIQNNFEISNLF